MIDGLHPLYVLSKLQSYSDTSSKPAHFSSLPQIRRSISKIELSVQLHGRRKFVRAFTWTNVQAIARVSQTDICLFACDATWKYGLRVSFTVNINKVKRSFLWYVQYVYQFAVKIFPVEFHENLSEKW